MEFFCHGLHPHPRLLQQDHRFMQKLILEKLFGGTRHISGKFPGECPGTHSGFFRQQFHVPVDSLLAMDYICFRKKVCTLPEFLQIVRNNYEGKENIRALAMKAPYWGDNTKASRELGKDILNSLQACSGDLLNERGGEYLYCLWIYREFRYWGEKMRALPDGRRDGDPLSQGLNPSDFRNREEATTTLNALSCLDYPRFASSNINMTFDKNRCTQEHLFSFFKAFIDLGLQILQPNSFSREELEEAMLHPEKHRNLIVKVCSFSASFVTLEPSWQEIIMARHPYS